MRSSPSDFGFLLLSYSDVIWQNVPLFEYSISVIFVCAFVFWVSILKSLLAIAHRLTTNTTPVAVGLS